MGTFMAVASALGGVYAQNNSLIAQGRANQKTKQNIITSQNYSFQNLEQQRRDAFESTIADLEKNKLQGNRQEASVRAAVNEGIMGGGRTANLINRAAAADTFRAISSIKTNYEKKSNEIDLNKESTALNAKQQVGSIQNVESPSMFSTLFSLGTSYFSYRQTQDSIKAIRTNAGVSSDRTVQSSYSNVLGSTDFGAPKYTFSYTNPFTNSYTRAGNNFSL